MLAQNMCFSSYFFEKYEKLSEMGPYGSVGAHIKTGKRYMAQDHFKTPPDPKKGHGMTKNPEKSKTSSRVRQDNSHRKKESIRQTPLLKEE